MAATSLHGIQDITGHLVVPAPSINTSVGANPTTVPLTCPAILAAVKTNTPTSFLQVYSMPAMLTNLQTFYTSLTTNVDPIQPITDTNSLEKIRQYLTSIDTVQIPILNLVKSCTGEASQSVSMDNYAAAKERMTTSQERLEFIQTPEQNVSYYEGWFPLFRPIVRPALFILFSVSLTLFLLSIILLLRMNGIELKLVFPEVSINPYGQAGGIPTSYKAVTGAAIVVGGLVGYYGSKNGWFGS
jgi:hypothetical protein